MAEPGTKLLEVLLDRLYATLVNGPLMSCRPHSSRQRVDLMQFSKLSGPAPTQVLSSLLGKERSARLVTPVASGAGQNGGDSVREDELRGLFAKLRNITEDAKTYEEDTGVQALFLGFPLLSLPPDAGVGATRIGKRILAPLAFIPLSVTIKATRPPAVTLEAIGDGADLIVPNAALLSWVERMTGKSLGELFADDEAADPWRELNSLVAAVLQALDLPPPLPLSPETQLIATPRSDQEESKTPGIVRAAVVGLFPAANQGLLNDLDALCSGERVTGPIESFLKAGTELGTRRAQAHVETTTSLAGSERCVSQVDPCQARAVHLARRVNGLVIHGPPGTGKSQTITNIIGDHLANGERVLFVCDKRTALDVVAHRLQGQGLGSLCAVVHDVRRDQRDLYRGLKDQLDSLPETQPNAAAVADLAPVDAEIGRIHAELTAFESALSERPDGVSPSFHELVGSWFSLNANTATPTTDLVHLTLDELVPLEGQVKEVMERGSQVQYWTNPWRHVLAGELSQFLAKPIADWRAGLQRLERAARGVDGFLDPHSPPFSPSGDAIEEGRLRRKLGELAAEALVKCSPAQLAHWVAAESASASAAGSEVASAEAHVALLTSPVDREIALALPPASAPIADLASWLGSLQSYLQIARKWYGFLFFGRRGAARRVLQRFGLALAEEGASRVSRFFERVRARRIVEGVVQQLASIHVGEASDADLVKAMDQYVAIFRAVAALEAPELAGTASDLRRKLADPHGQQACIHELKRSEEQGAAIHDFERALAESGLFRPAAQRAVAEACRSGKPALPLVTEWVSQLPTIEGLLRIEGLLGRMRPELSAVLRALLESGATPELAWATVKKAALGSEITRRIRTTPILHTVDGDRVMTAHRRYRELNAWRRNLTRDLAKHVWVSRQRERLLASTGSRLNPAGAEIRRRLVSRGERAMRVRQMIAAGAGIPGGDPLFDLRPVWMASPDVVAQLFPRQALFDVVIFDEASQCRLEEALPVLLRGKRVVIAGDPQQLPPTRFFESGVAQSKEQEAEDEQGLFEAQQSEVEDLLGAALNLSVEQAYLDVHYRSRNADLIEFSNKNFYESRLQAIPAHPSRRTRLPPLRMIPVGGVYENRANAREALEVVKIVKRLLESDTPPSIGIACFNLNQRDVIVEALDRAAAEDPLFGARLATARVRKGEASFEGLFVRNLENVQGDERDHMIISTTYGPDKQGRFYRRFGPLGQTGGGRRLNVLVTRARQAVHLVTSIPPEVYRGLAAPPPGATPNGGWLLFSYLVYAEFLEKVYSEAFVGNGGTANKPRCLVADTRRPSTLAVALGEHFADEHGASAQVHWGNDGFCVDAALAHPERPEDVTIGILCDGTRFDKAADRVQWDIFRTEVLEGQDWRLFRVWSPQFFRDPDGTVTRIKQALAQWLAEEAAEKAANRTGAENRTDLQLLN